MSDSAFEETAAIEADLAEAEILGDALDAQESTPTKKGKKAKTKDDEPVVEAVQGLVLYTDGGCRPNPGFGGWGLHGYLYRDESPKKGSGHPDHVLTNRGYTPKTDWAKANPVDKREITPVHYVDGFGSFLGEVTNNIAEIQATTVALEHAQQWAVKSVLVLTDSEHVIKGLNGWVDNWQRNGWVRGDGSPIANVEYWKKLIALRDQLRERGIRVEIDWVKGHAGFEGNTQVDTLATIGVMTSRRKRHVHDVTTTVAEGYWKYDAEKPPFLNHRFMYMNTNARNNRPGEYFIGNAGNEPELLGKRQSDGAFGLVRLTRPDPVVEMVRNRQISAAGAIDQLLLIRLENIFRPDIHQRIVTHGDVVLIQNNPKTLDLVDLEEEPLVKELTRPGIGWRVVEAIAELSVKLDAYLDKDAQVIVTDLTPILYETSSKTDKKGETTTVMKLKPEYGVGFAALPVDVAYKVGAGIALTNITVTLGIDMLDRNSLKRLEDQLPKVSLLTWMEADDAFRYATVVEADGDVGIWAGSNSNLRIVKQ